MWLMEGHILYSGKILWNPIFAAFAGDRQTAKIKLEKKLDCTAHNGLECPHPQKLNPQNSKDCLSTKIEPRKNFPLYSMCVPSWKVT